MISDDKGWPIASALVQPNILSQAMFHSMTRPPWSIEMMASMDVSRIAFSLAWEMSRSVLAFFWSSTSVQVPIQYMNSPEVLKAGVPRTRNQRYWPSYLCRRISVS